MLIKFREIVPFQKFTSSEIHVAEMMDFYHSHANELVLYCRDNTYYSMYPISPSHFEELESKLYNDGKIDLSDTNIVFTASIYRDRGDDQK